MSDSDRVRANSRSIEFFLDMLAAERGAAENTLAAYRRDLELAAHAFGRSGNGIRSTCTHTNRGTYQRKLNWRHRCPNTDTHSDT